MSNKKRHGGRLVFDLETSPTVCWLWRPGYGINVPASNVMEDGKIICVAWQWENEKKIYALQWNSRQDDKKLLEAFIPVMEEADEIIGHNHRGFDIRWVRTRALAHGLPCPPSFVTTDTWLQAKKYFRFPGNGLKAIAKYLKLEGKLEPSAGLWQRVVFDKNKSAMREMIKYCKRDVDQTMKVFAKFVPYTDPVGHVGNSMTDCPHCGSRNTKWEKDRITQKGGKHTQFRCHEKGCGKYSTVASSKWYSNKKI